MAGERDGLPDRALVQLAVADQAERAAVAAVGAVGEGAGRAATATPWPSEPAGELDAGDVALGMAGERAAVAAVAGDDLGLVEHAGPGEHGVEARMRRGPC